MLSLTQLPESRAQVHCATVLFGSAIPGSRSEGQGSDLSHEEGGTGAWRSSVELGHQRQLSAQAQGARKEEHLVSSCVSHRPGHGWACGMVCADRRASERRVTLKRCILSPHPIFLLPCKVPLPPQTLLCCLCLGIEGLLLCKVILLVSLCLLLLFFPIGLSVFL